jgi:hypothetical protein
MHRRAFLALGLSVLCGVSRADWPKDAQGRFRSKREMWRRPTPELGLEIWIENQPAWEDELVQVNGQTQLAVQSPDSYHPPAAILYASWPAQRVAEGDELKWVADAAIRRAGENFGLNKHRSRLIEVAPAVRGALKGYAGEFVGRVEGVDMDVSIFIGQAPGRFPVSVTVYTLKGKMPLLSEVLRRSFAKLGYL